MPRDLKAGENRKRARAARTAALARVELGMPTVPREPAVGVTSMAVKSASQDDQRLIKEFLDRKPGGNKTPEKHGHNKRGQRSAEYNIWSKMTSRCNDLTDKGYGGRGIRVCDRWSSFSNFLADMGPRPTSKHSIDRFPNNDGNYEPENCRWATASEQARNRRNNRMVFYKGRNMPLAEACSLSGLKFSTAWERIEAGLSFDEAVARPPYSPKNKRQPRALIDAALAKRSGS